MGEVEEYIVPAEHDSIAEVICPLGPARRRRSVPEGFVQGITMSVSNNGQNYSTEHTLYVLDGDCQDTVNVLGDIQFTLRVNALIFLKIIQINVIYHRLKKSSNPFDADFRMLTCLLSCRTKTYNCFI